jgi:hypothetical protein
VIQERLRNVVTAHSTICLALAMFSLTLHLRYDYPGASMHSLIWKKVNDIAHSLITCLIRDSTPFRSIDRQNNLRVSRLRACEVFRISSLQLVPSLFISEWVVGCGLLCHEQKATYHAAVRHHTARVLPPRVVGDSSFRI